VYYYSLASIYARKFVQVFCVAFLDKALH
jgi:hypothetical protein